MDTVRWGVVGPGRIADKVVRDLPLVDGASAAAVASRSAERAAAFAARHDVARTHDSYRAIVDDPDVDVLYIATPHPQHRAVALAALRAAGAVASHISFCRLGRLHFSERSPCLDQLAHAVSNDCHHVPVLDDVVLIAQAAVSGDHDRAGLT